MRISAKLPLSSQPLARSFLFPSSMALWISLMLMGMLGATMSEIWPETRHAARSPMVTAVLILPDSSSL